MKVSPRRRARECAVQALYSWHISQNPVSEIELHFIADQDMNGVDMPYFRKLLRGSAENIEQIDGDLLPFLDRALNELDPIELTILRVSAYELRFELDVPYKVAINEGIEVAKTFGSDDSHKYINGVLDKLAPSLGRR